MVLRPPGITTMTAKQESQVRRHPLVVYTMESIQSLCNSLCVDHLPMLLHRCQALMLFQTTSQISIFWRFEYRSKPKVTARMFDHPSFDDVMNISWGWFLLMNSRESRILNSFRLKVLQGQGSCSFKLISFIKITWRLCSITHWFLKKE